MRELSPHEVDFVAGAAFTWQGAGASMAAGALGGALLGGITYSVYELLAA